MLAESPMVVTASLLVLLGYAAWRDLATRTIPDGISLAIMMVGAGSRLCDGWQALGCSLLLAAAIFFALLPLHSRGLIGGADLKLLAALALGLSPFATYQLLTATAIAGGVLAGIYIVLRRVLAHLVRTPGPIGRQGLVPFRIAIIESWRIRRGAPLPYGIAIALGAALVLHHPGV
jgi:prepilin peptidase CpaA